MVGWLPSPELNVDAASQVAHAISTHEIVPEFDYFTALDDEQDSAGAAMIDTLEFNSSTLYRYANVNVKELFHNLGSAELTLKGIELFIKEFVLSMPTGKQNSFANKTILLSTKESRIDNQVKDISSLLTNVAECLERMMNDENISD